MRATRLLGLDVARALAIVGMVVVNLDLSFHASTRDPSVLADAAALLRGRAAATFVVLAGMGLSLLSAWARERGGPQERWETQALIVRRGGFLLAVGLGLMAVGWWADILHYYAFYLWIAAALVYRSARDLRRVALGSVALFLLLLPAYERGWDFDTLTYVDLWTPLGFTHNLLFNGLHPVFPWVAFVVWGMWLGRQDLRSAAVQGWLMGGGLGVASATLALSGAVSAAAPVLQPLLIAEPIPPGIPYLLSAGGIATALIGGCLWATQRAPNAPVWSALVPFGQHALTWYVGHVVLLIVPLSVLEAEQWARMPLVWAASLVFCSAAMAFSSWWAPRYRRGPLSLVMRRFTG